MQGLRIAIGEHIELQSHQSTRTLLEQQGDKRAARFGAQRR
jgi:hypothetical protein